MLIKFFQTYTLKDNQAKKKNATENELTQSSKMLNDVEIRHALFDEQSALVISGDEDSDDSDEKKPNKEDDALRTSIDNGVLQIDEL